MRSLAFFALLLACPWAVRAQTTTFNGIVKDLTSTPVSTGLVTFQLKPGVDTTISGNARFTSTTVNCEIHNPAVVSTSGIGTITVVVGTAQTWQVGDSLIFVGTGDATLNGSSVASPYTITVVNSTTSFNFTQSGTHTNGAGGTVGGIYKSGGTGACVVTQNTAITPANTSYNVGLWPLNSLTSSFNTYAIGAGPVDISTVVPTPGQQPAYSFLDAFSNQSIQSPAIKTFAPGSSLVINGQFTANSPSSIGSELWVCLSAGCLYQTVAAAYAALPTCTITPTPVNAGGTAGSSVSVPCGTIHVAPGTYATPASTVIINSSFVRVLGSGQFNTILNCSTACYEITGDSSWGGTVTAYPGGFWDLDMEGVGSTGTGLLLIGATGLQLHRIRIAGFSGTGGQGLMVQNDLTAYSERMNWSDVILDNNKVGLRLDAPASGLVNLSMGHNNWFGLKIQMNNGQTGMKLTGGVQLYESVVQGVFNSYPPNTNTYTALDMSGTTANAVFQGYLFMPVDNGGGGTMTVCTGCTGGVSGNFHNSWGSFFVNNSLFTTEDGGPVLNATATGAPNDGLTFALNHVNKYQWYLDGGGGLSLFNGSVNSYSFDPQLFCEAGSASGSVCLVPSSSAAAGNLSLPNQTDTLVARTTTDTLTNKTLTSPVINGTNSGAVSNTGINNNPGNTVALTADWTCGTGGTVSSCTSATTIGSGGGVPLTFTLPLVAQSYTLECDGVVGQATATTANQWNLLTATNGATNVTATYDMYTAATANAGGAVTDQASTTTTFQIAPSWTLGGTGTKMPFHVWAKIEGASASGTVVSLQLIAPTVGDLVTIYRGTACRVF